MVPSRGQRVTVWERPLIKREASDKYGEASYKEREADEWGDGREAGVRLQAAGKLPGSRPPHPSRAYCGAIFLSHLGIEMIDIEINIREVIWLGRGHQATLSRAPPHILI